MPTSPSPTLNSHAEKQMRSPGVVFHAEVKRMHTSSEAGGTTVDEMRPETPYYPPGTRPPLPPIQTETHETEEPLETEPEPLSGPAPVPESELSE